MKSGEEATSRPSSVVALIVAWAIIGVPMAWGVAQTVIKSMALFR